MNFSPNWLLIGLILMMTVVIGLGCRSFFSERKTADKVKIADAVSLSEKWTEFSPPQPLEAAGKVQFVSLKIPDAKGWADENQKAVLLTDASKVIIEVELTDENGRSTLLFPNGFAGEYVEFGKRAANKENVEESYFQIGTKFPKIRLRSDKPIEVKEIIWTKFEF